MKQNQNKPSLSPIEVPIDFKELITLQPLITQMEIFEILKENLDKYRWNYFMSKQHTAFEVLSIIPEDQWQEYFENTFGDRHKIFRPNNTVRAEFTDLPSVLKDRYTHYCEYGSKQYKDYETREIKTVKNGKQYTEAVQEILIDTKNRKLLFVDHDIRSGHQWYGGQTLYHLETDKKLGIQVLTVEFKWSFVPWYSNRSEPKYFSHYYKFDLTNDCILKIDKSQMMR